MSLTITQVKITDSIEARARTCQVTLAPSSRVGSPVGEFQYPGDIQGLSGTNIRPNGSTIKVVVPYRTVSHDIFSGSVEQMDDLEDPDQHTYDIVLSNIPANQSHRQKVTQIFQPVTYEDPCPEETTTSHAILSAVCASAGIPFGRCDLPDYVILGTYEVIKKSPVQVAEELCQPYNMFEFKHYYVRTEEGYGLQIICVDYTLGSGVSNALSVLQSTIESKTISYQRYMPENKIGRSGDILLTGGDKIATTGASSEVVCWQTYQTKVSTSPTENGPSLGELGGNTDLSNSLPSYVITTTQIQFIVSVTNMPGQTWSPGTGEGGQELGIDAIIAALQSQAIQSASILESRPVYTIVECYEWADGFMTNPELTNPELSKKIMTYYYYGTFTMPVHWYSNETKTVTVPVQEVSTVEVYLRGNTKRNQPYDQSMTVRSYSYDSNATQTGTMTQTYYMDRGLWTLSTTDSEHSTPEGYTNSFLEYFSNAGTAAIPTSKAGLVDGKNVAVTAPIDKYRLLNGAEVKINRNPYTVSEAKALLEEELKERYAYAVSVPTMNSAGLGDIYALILRQQSLEDGNVYWQSTKITCTLNTSITVGESVIVDGIGGICSSVEHFITQDSAITVATLKRIITGGI